MRQRLIRPADLRPMAWKNGGGVTTEIAADPPGAGLDDFAWRVSIADVAASGPFSVFPGVDRIIVLIAGPGMILRGPEGDVALRRFEPHAFAGETPIEGILSGGPVRDFNLMSRRGRVRAELTVGRAALGPARGTRVLIHCAEGSAGTLSAGETLLMDAVVPGSVIELRPDPGAVLLRVDFA